jgi:cell surface hyaluronidase
VLGIVRHGRPSKNLPKLAARWFNLAREEIKSALRRNEEDTTSAPTAQERGLIGVRLDCLIRLKYAERNPMFRRVPRLPIRAAVVFVAFFVTLHASLTSAQTTAKRWSTSYPTTGSVTIAAGDSVLLDTNLALAGLTINGKVTCANQDLSVSARWIMVHGELVCGTPAAPFSRKLTITLTGSNTAENVMGMGTKFVGAMNGGKIQLIGQTRVNWLRLATTAARSSTQITLSRAPGWRVGERLVVASTDYHFDHAEEVSVTSIAGATVHFSSPLKYEHWCATESFGARSLQECAEVGLLSRNIVIQGDAGSATGGFGGHAMVMKGGSAIVSGVEFFRMGQRGRVARYPFHWHLAGQAAGQYLKNSSIHHAYNRFVSIHGTHGAQVANNVGYDTVGHAYYLEDGIETKNVIEGNLGLVVRVAADGKPTASDREPSVFWISNPDNYVRNNVAAGCEHTGFWLGFPEHPLGLSATTAVWPRRTPLLQFSGNVSHSNHLMGLFVDRAERADRTTEGSTWYEPRRNPADANSPVQPPVFSNFTAYKNRNEGVWIRSFAGPVLSAAKLADNWMGAYFANIRGAPPHTQVGYVDNALVVGETANKGNPESWEAKGLDGREVPRPWSAGDSIRGIEYYDGPMGVRGGVFANFQSNAQRKAGALTSLAPNPYWVSSLNFSEGNTFVNANRVYFHDLTASNNGDAVSTFLDTDGSVSGVLNAKIVPKNPVLVTSQCRLNAQWNGYVCPHEYVNFRFVARSGENPDGTVIQRDDGASWRLVSPPFAAKEINTNLISERPYALSFPGGVTPRHLVLVVNEKANKAVRVSMPYPTATFTVTFWGSPVAKTTTLAQLASGGYKYFYDSAQRRLHLRLASTAGNWEEIEVRRP